jgi:hypothetical protein
LSILTFVVVVVTIAVVTTAVWISFNEISKGVTSWMEIRNVVLFSVVLVLLAGAMLGLLRANVLGYPRVRIAADGVWVSGARVDWVRIRSISSDGVPVAVRGFRIGAVPYLVMEIQPGALSGVSWYDRLFTRRTLWGTQRSAWFTERQLGMKVGEALRDVPPEHRKP